MLKVRDNEEIMKKIREYIDDINYGKIILSIHQGDVAYIEKQEKEKIK